MNQKPDTTWEFGSIPMIEPEYLGGVLATSSDIAFLIDAETKISSILVQNSLNSGVLIPQFKNFFQLSFWKFIF